MKRTTPPKKATARSKGSAKPKAGRKTIVKRVKAVLDPRVIELQAQANRAKAKGELDRTIELLTQALAIGSLPFEVEYDLLLQRGLNSSDVGNNTAYRNDAQAMFQLAKQHGDVQRQAAALGPWVEAARNAGSAAIREVVKLPQSSSNSLMIRMCKPIVCTCWRLAVGLTINCRRPPDKWKTLCDSTARVAIFLPKRIACKT